MPPKPLTDVKIGDDAVNRPPAGDTTNESTSMDQRAPDRITSLEEGPKRGQSDNYLPSRYRTRDREVTTAQGKVQVPGNIREDR